MPAAMPQRLQWGRSQEGVWEEAMAGDVGDGWQRCEAPDGTPYYHHSATARTTWTDPAAEDEGEAGEVAPSSWVALVTEEGKRWLTRRAAPHAPS